MRLFERFLNYKAGSVNLFHLLFLIQKAILKELKTAIHFLTTLPYHLQEDLHGQIK
jgi:hypothetical protein